MLGNLSDKTIDYLNIDYLVENDNGNFIADGVVFSGDSFTLPLAPNQEKELIVKILGKRGLKKGKIIFQYGNNGDMSRQYSRSLELLLYFTILPSIDIVNLDMINMRKFSLLKDVVFDNAIVEKLQSNSQIEWFLLILDILNEGPIEVKINFAVKSSIPNQGPSNLCELNALVSSKELKRILIPFMNDPSFPIIKRGNTSQKSDMKFTKEEEHHYIELSTIIEGRWNSKTSFGILKMPRLDLPKHLKYTSRQKLILKAGFTDNYLLQYISKVDEVISFNVRVENETHSSFIIRIIPKNEDETVEFTNFVVKGILQIHSSQVNC